ncbi:1117_t:CDS:10 [Entrophospora sp. SA101]|nr:1117_t:CDS:10 [Entrophospora sp. SA101]CAJ0827550.1 5125_t:CDS:10 [Entrophospora sp. SA101]
MPSTNLRSLEFILVTAQRSPSNNIKSKDLEEYDGKLRNAMIECDDDKDVEIDANEYNLVVDFDEYELLELENVISPVDEKENHSLSDVNDHDNLIDATVTTTSSSYSSRNASIDHISRDFLEANGSNHRLYVPGTTNNAKTTVIERIRTPRPLKNDYVEVRTVEDDSDRDSVGKTKRQKLTSIEETVHGERNLAFEAMPPLIISVAGLMLAGWLLDVVQHWPVFNKIPELFILVPVLLNLKGNLEMNLASRLSTSANLGELDKPSVRYALVWGNLAVLQVQSLIVGAVAGLFSFIEGIIFHPSHVNSFYESMLVIVASMICAALSSMILDNIACPMASSLGDLLTLVILAVCGEFLLRYLLLEKYIERYNGLALLTPVLNGIAGNLGSIYASRISTRLHSGTEENYRRSEITLTAIVDVVGTGLLVLSYLGLERLNIGGDKQVDFI